MKLREIAGRLGCRLAGDGDLEISGVAGMEHAGPGQLTFLANPKYGPQGQEHTQASAILVSQEIPGVEIAFLISENPYLDFARALALFYQPPRPGAGRASAGLRGAHRDGRRELLHRTVRGGRRARPFGPQRGAASPRRALRRRARSATISWRTRMPWCANSAASAIA